MPRPRKRKSWLRKKSRPSSSSSSSRWRMASSLPGIFSSSAMSGLDCSGGGRPRGWGGESARAERAGGKVFGEAHADLRPGVRVNRPAGLAGNHGADDVGNGQRLRAFLLGLALGGDGVGGFARLADEDGERAGVDDRVAVAVLGAVVHLHRQARQTLDHVLAHQRRVPGGPAGDDLDFAEAPEVFVAELYLLAEVNLAAFARDPSEQGVAHGARLLETFFQHEVLEAALLGLDGVPGDVLDVALDGVAGEVHH